LIVENLNLTIKIASFWIFKIYYKVLQNLSISRYSKLGFIGQFFSISSFVRFFVLFFLPSMVPYFFSNNL